MTMDRRRFLGAVGAAVALGAVEGCDRGAVSPVVGVRAVLARPGEGITLAQARARPTLALQRLQEGNARYVGGRGAHACATPQDFAELARGQAPFAAIVACADSRTAPETIFDQGVGEIFTVRTAGNLVVGGGAAIKGSLEYAVGELGVSVIMVLGHTGCGAIKAALALSKGAARPPGDIGPLLELILPAVDATAGLPGDALLNVTKENVRRAVGRLRALNPVLGPAIERGALVVVGAVHELGTGRITLV